MPDAGEQPRGAFLAGLRRRAKGVVTATVVTLGVLGALLALLFQEDRWFADLGVSGQGVAAYLAVCAIGLALSRRTRWAWWLFLVALLPVALAVIAGAVLVVFIVVYAVTHWTFR